MVKIFLVDDEPLLLESLEIVLTVKGGFDVIGSAGNGTEALKKLKEKTPDVMLIDLNMPGMGGIELIKRVKEEAGLKEMKVVATGGLGSIIANATDMIDEYDRRLTMKGLEIIYKKNCK